MKRLNERMFEISNNLQSLASPEFFPEIKDAVEKKDKKSLIAVCRKAKVPTAHMNSIVSFLLSAEPQVKWPDYY
jgi:hypothetical protein